MNCKEVKVAGEILILFAERAIFWNKKKILFIADTHFGKTTAFQKNGISVSQINIKEDLERLASLINETGAEKLFILGDMFHAKAGKSGFIITALAEWRKKFTEIEITLIRGNHDKHSGDPPEELDIKCCNEPCYELPFVLKHDPSASKKGYVLAGHVHPCVNLKGKGKQKATLPCFYFGKDYGLLPSFGSFTGSFKIYPETEDKIFVIAGNELIEVKK